jgi:hypothetical protein
VSADSCPCSSQWCGVCGRCASPLSLSMLVDHGATPCITVHHCVSRCNTVNHRASRCITVQHRESLCVAVKHVECLHCARVRACVCVCVIVFRCSARALSGVQPADVHGHRTRGGAGCDVHCVREAMSLPSLLPPPPPPHPHTLAPLRRAVDFGRPHAFLPSAPRGECTASTLDRLAGTFRSRGSSAHRACFHGVTLRWEHLSTPCVPVRGPWMRW